MRCFKLFSFYLLLTFCIASCSLDRSDHYEKLYLNSLQYADLHTAAYALNHILELNDSYHWSLDSLVDIYYYNGNYNGAFRLLNENGMVRYNPYHNKISAYSALQIGEKEVAFNQLQVWVNADTTNDLEAKLILADLYAQNNKKRLALQTWNEVMEHTKSLKTSFQLFTDDEPPLFVNAYSLAHYKTGLYFWKQLNDLVSAEKHLTEAISKQKNFLAAQKSLLEVREQTGISQ